MCYQAIKRASPYKVLFGSDGLWLYSVELHKIRVLKFISEVVDFLEDIRWLKQDINGSYQVTRKGQDEHYRTRKTND
jgi:hypothetical protein